MRKWKPGLLSMMAAGALVVATSPAVASAQGRGKGIDVPPGQLPPAGACRVWYDGRPPGRQPAPTSCRTAERVAYETGGRVLYGADQRRDDGRYDGKGDRRYDDDRWEGDDDCDSSKGRVRGDCGDRDNRCLDRDHDGRCDYAEGQQGGCMDRDRDGRCDYLESQYPTTLPRMLGTYVLARRSAWPAWTDRWVTGARRATYTDRDRNGTPEWITWLASNGGVLQRWHDDDRDGRADRVDLYRNGRVVRTIRERWASR